MYSQKPALKSDLLHIRYEFYTGELPSEAPSTFNKAERKLKIHSSQVHSLYYLETIFNDLNVQSFLKNIQVKT